MARLMSACAARSPDGPEARPGDPGGRAIGYNAGMKARHSAWRSILVGAAFLLGGCGDADPEPTGTSALAGKNVLVVLLDAVATDHLAFYGYDRATTPHLAELAAEGWTFTDVTAQAPYTIASVASLMTGEAVDLHGVTAAGEVASEELPMLAERFGAAGYRTAAFSANAHVQRGFGFGRGFDAFERYRPDLSLHHAVPREQRDAVQAFLAEAADDPAPFFAYVHLLPPHAPYDPPEPARSAFAAEWVGTAFERAGGLPNLMPLSHGARTPDAAERQAIEDLYDASLLHVDGVLRGLDLALEELGLQDDTLLLVVSDHGEAFGQHGLWQHARTVYDEMVRVPMVLRLPADSGLPASGVVDHPVALADVAPTLMELFDLGGRAPASSTSLAPLLAGAPGVERAHPILTRTAGPGEHVAIRFGDFKLIHETREGGPWHLFDLAADPGEEHPIHSAKAAPTPRLARAFRELRGLLMATRMELAAAARATTSVEVDDATSSELDALGYGGKAGGLAPADGAALPSD